MKPITPNRAAPLQLPSRRAVVVLVMGLLSVYAGGAIASAVQLQKIWAGPQAREWDRRLRSGIAGLERSGRRPMVADNVTPPEIIAGWVAPYNRLSRILPMYVGPIQVDGPLDAPLVRIESDGTVRKAKIVDAYGSEPLLDLVRSHQIDVGLGGRTVLDRQGLCVIADGAPVSIERRLNQILGAGTTPYYLRLVYRVWQPLSLPLLADPGTGYPAAPDNTIALAPSSNASLAWLGVEGAPHRVQVTVPPLTTVCISHFDIVTVRNTS